MAYKDITLCKGGECKAKSLCKRHVYYKEAMKLEEIMSIFMTPPLEKDKNGKDTCQYFWDTRQTEIK